MTISQFFGLRSTAPLRTSAVAGLFLLLGTGSSLGKLHLLLPPPPLCVGARTCSQASPNLENFEWVS